MPIICPKCGSQNIDRRNYGKRTASVIGGAGGAVSGALLALKAAEEATDGEAGALALISSATLGAIAGAVAGALTGTAAGIAVGSVAGQAVDEHVLDNYKCLECNHTFNE